MPDVLSERPNLLERIDQGRVKFELLGSSQSLARLGRFVLFARVGAGGMGVIYHAYDPQLDRGVAVKLLHPGVTARGGHRRLLREARAMARLTHPHVVQVFEVGELEGHVYLVMEFVPGPTLRAWLAAAPRTWREVVSIFRQAADGLAATHAHALVHCDFKPENVLIGADGRARVGDFGLVQTSTDPPPAPGVDRLRVQVCSPETTSTATSMGGGTPRYMAPEQHARSVADARSDQYSFCAALYEALAPAQFEAFVREAPVGVRALRGELPSPLVVPGAPPGLGRLLARGLEPDPERRWPSLAVVYTELGRLVATPSRVRGWWGLAAGMLVGLLAGAGYGFAGAGACGDGAAQLEAVWGEPQRQQLRSAIMATRRNFAPETASRIEEQLDGYARAWRETGRAACEAHRGGQMSDALLDRTTLCLVAARDALAGLVSRIVAIDAAALERATKATLALPDLARCRDVTALLADVAPPSDPAVARDVLAVQSQLTTVTSEWMLGDLDDAVRRTEEALGRAQLIGHAPLIAAALQQLGALQSERDARAEAESTFTRAAWIAAEVGDDERLGRVAGSLAFVIAQSGNRWAEARTWVQLARAMTRKAAPHRTSHFDALFASGLVEYRAGRFAESREWFAQALAHAEQHLDPNGEPMLAAQSMLAVTLGELGEYDSALAHFDRLAQLRIGVFGPSHPTIAADHNNRAAVLRRSGREDEALVDFDAALSLWLAAYGPDHPDVGMAHGNIASALLSRGRPGDLEAAEPHLHRAIATRERSFGPDDVDLLAERNNLGNLHAVRLELDEADRQFTAVVAAGERTVGADHPLVALALTGLGEVAALRGDFAAARHHASRALASDEASFGPDHPDIAWTLRQLAELDLRDGALASAAQRLDRADALDARAADEERTHAALASRGRLALSRGDAATACGLLARALDGREQRAFDPVSAALASDLARALVAAGRSDEAGPLAARAAAFYRRGGPALAWRVAALELLQRPSPGGEYTRADVRPE